MTRTPYDTPITNGREQTSDEWHLAMCEMEADADYEVDTYVVSLVVQTQSAPVQAAADTQDDYPDDCSAPECLYQLYAQVRGSAGAGEPAEVPQLMRRQAG